MKSPFTGKVMQMQMGINKIVFRKETFAYQHKSYFCAGSKEQFTTEELDTFNLNQVYNQYRDKHNIPFPDEIRAVRDRYDVSAAMMSKILGLGTHSYRNYEKGEVPSLSNANLIKTILGSINNFKLLVDLHAGLTEKEKTTIYKKVKKARDLYHLHKEDLRYRETLFEHSLPDNFTGYRKPVMDKMLHMILFFAHRLQPTETTLNKLLFYADFSNYRSRAFSISGAPYMAHNYGPVPVRYSGIFDYATHTGLVHTKVVHFSNGYMGKCFYGTEDADFDATLFTKEELGSLEDVVSIFKGCSATQIMEKSHEEHAWIKNEAGKAYIDYNDSFSLKHI